MAAPTVGGGLIAWHGPGHGCPLRASAPSASLSLESRTAIWFQSAPAEPDALYARRTDLASAQAAARIWDERLRASGNTDFDAAWKLSRAEYWLGGHLPEPERRAAFEHGVAAGEAASAVRRQRPEGHFWTAANMGALAESFGLRQGIKYRGAIKQELETVLSIDPSFMQGSAYRALGRWYFKVPRLFGGSNQKSVEYLQRSLTYDPTNHASLFFLAETLRTIGRTADARAALEKILASPVHPAWEPEDLEFKAKARAMLTELSRDRAISQSHAVSGHREIARSIARRRGVISQAEVLEAKRRGLDREIDYLS